MMNEEKYTIELTEDDISFIVDALIHKSERVVTKKELEQCVALIDCLDALLPEHYKIDGLDTFLTERYKNEHGGLYDAK